MVFNIRSSDLCFKLLDSITSLEMIKFGDINPFTVTVKICLATYEKPNQSILRYIVHCYERVGQFPVYVPHIPLKETERGREKD